ncbi:MAG: chemotaxis response regulator protein-glutamate methylesterase [Phycisphaerae bacterium]|nr:chemotaxis response regulator protein-glutamate methylesterase [Phycisphaerae bacterium]
MKRNQPIKVLIVDDSPIIRSILTRVLSDQPDINLVGGAKDPFEARDLIAQHRPDVIILDIEMPRMDGMTFLRKLRAHYPVPVLMCSGVAPANSRLALEAIEIGAVDVVAKPNAGGTAAMVHLGEELADKVRAAAMASAPKPLIAAKPAVPEISFRAAGIDPQRYLIAVGASTGGTEAIKALLSRMPADSPPIAIVQHMPVGFTASFAERLNDFCPLKVSEAVEGDELIAGRAFIARGDAQLVVRVTGTRRTLAYAGNTPVNRHCPSVDVLFHSVAEKCARQTVGIILTGMGADGARGLLAMRQAGSITFGQDAASCVVYGMPKAAADIGAVEHAASPTEMPRLVVQALRRIGSPARGAAIRT